MRILLASIALSSLAAAPPIDLPEGFTAELVAAPPLVVHPITAAVGERGQLFVGDAAGKNLNKADLEKELPNRVVLLTDADGDGVYENATVFADKMTFPEGGAWLDGSLYVASPPGIWKLTDTDGDGVADQRKMIASGFDYTGNAADVHGPFLHPNGRLYWCHGRKAHTATQSDGTVVHTGAASGIWSCRPDGLDLRWHAFASGDNPVEIDFTPEGEIVGTMNLFYSHPRGDTIVHWLRGGVYPREDQLKVIEGLPRTLDVMPVVHNFRHVAVSGCTFYRSGALDADWRGNMFVAHFNTRRVTRLEVARDGATYKVAEREFFTLREADAHLTDVLEDRDGSLLVVDTGGWFRIGCPSSLTAKPDVPGGIYRIRRTAGPVKVEPWGAATAKVWALARKADGDSIRELCALLGGKDLSVARAAGNALASLANPAATDPLIAALSHKDAGVQLAAANALGSLPQLEDKSARAFMQRLEGPLEPAVEHQTMYALLRGSEESSRLLLTALSSADKPTLQRRALRLLDQAQDSPIDFAHVLPLLASADPALAHAAATCVARRQGWMPAAAEYFSGWITAGKASVDRLATIETAVQPWLGNPTVRGLVSLLLSDADLAHRRTAWRIIATSAPAPAAPEWIGKLQSALARSAPGDQALVIDAIAHARSPQLSVVLTEFAAVVAHPLALRLKALRAAINPRDVLDADSFAFALDVLSNNPSAAQRLEAARILAATRLDREQQLKLAPAFIALGPLELRELLPILRKSKEPEIGAAFAHALSNAASLGSLQESEIRSAMSNFPPDIFEIVSPALRAVAAEDVARHRKLETLPALVNAKGNATEGRKIFESGKGVCMTCHRVGDVGNFVGPNLSEIGKIRSARDLLESILFPSATIAHDYEAHSIETADGRSLIGVVRRNLPESMVLVDPSGQEQTLPRGQIVAMQMLPTSLMPTGLDRTLTEPELLDLVAYLASRK